MGHLNRLDQFGTYFTFHLTGLRWLLWSKVRGTWKKANLFTKVTNQGQEMRTRGWIFIKNLENQKIYSEAKYAVWGFQEKSEIQSDLLTGGKECLHIYYVSHYCQ